MNTQSQSPQSAPGRTPPTGSESRPIQPVTVSYASSWMHFLIVVCLVVAWYFPLRILITHWLWAKVEPGARNSYAFVALAYEGVSKRTNEVSRALFTEHLNAMRARGYVPIGIEDVQRLVYEGKPVPAKAVLLTFDHGRKTTYFAVDSILKSAGWNAVMFLWTHPIINKDSAALLWPYVRIMSRSGTWELGAQSHNGFAPVPASPRGYLGHFMTTAQWLPDENRFETPAEFANRLTQDHETCLKIIEQKVGIKPVAYAYPYGDFGQFESRASFARRVNLQLAGKYHSLCFLTGNLAANTRYSDPKRLNRVRVRPEWSGEDLVDFLDRSWPVEGMATGSSPSRMAAAWIVDWGGMKEEKGRMTLYAPEQITGAKMWLAGSDLTKDFYSRVVFSDLNGQLGIYARATADEESFVYLGLDSKGSVWLRQTQFGKDALRLDEAQVRDMNIWLRQKHVSLERFTLASSHVTVEPSREHVLDVFARGPLLFACLDGRPIFNDRVLLRGDMRPGMLGVSVWDSEKGRARVTVSEVTLLKQAQALASWNSTANMQDAHVFRWIHQNAYHITDLCPPWISFSPSGQMTKSSWDPTTYLMLARMYKFNLLPRVIINDERALSRLAPSQLADRIKDFQSQGLYVAMDEMQNPASSHVVAWLQQCASDLRARGLQLLVRLPAALEKPVFVRSLLALAPHIQIVANATSPLRVSDGKSPKIVAAQLEQIPESDPEKDLPIFYEINSLPETQGEPSAAAKSARWQQEGQAAFLDADYNKALSLWQKWFARDAHNPRAPMLIGDAYLRLGDLQQALTNYDVSLNLDPGQIRLALRRAGLLATMGRTEDSMNSLNLYARLFPENTEIMLAQAEWLRRHDRGGEAVPIVRHVTKVDTNSFEAVALMLRLPIPPEEFRAAMETLQRIGAQPEFHYELGQAIWKYDLLSMPGSHALLKLVRRIATQTKDARVAALFERLMPRTKQVTDNFSNGQISDAWWMDGGDCSADAGKLLLRADDTHTEATVRLLGSEHFRDAYVETFAQRKGGAFWLYVRRTADHLARFGWDESGTLYLQLWRNGHILDQKTRAWTDPKTLIRLRLEVRGDGMMGYIDGQPAFSSPMELPHDFELGWIGFAAYSPERGKAQVLLDRASAGPLAPRVLALPRFKSDEEVDTALAAIRPEVNRISDLAPAWFRIVADGSWQATLGSDEPLLRLFARYYRVRLLPIVTVDGGATVNAEDLLKAASRYNVDGFVLSFPVLPDAKWFENAEGVLGASNIKVIAVALDSEKGIGQMRGIAAGADLLSAAAEGAQETLVHPWTREGTHKSLNEYPTAKPVIVTF